VLEKRGDSDEAIAVLRDLKRLRPGSGRHLGCLSRALREKGPSREADENLEAAAAAWRSAIRLKPDFAEAHCNLGLVLPSRGEYAAALDALRTGHALGSKRPGWPYPSAEWVRHAERLATLADRLPEILRGDDRLADNAERLALAQMCYDMKRPAAAARLWAEALTADPKLGDDRRAPPRYDSACAAALAGSGQGKDHPPFDDAAKATLRGRARDWLKAELATWTKLFETGPTTTRQVIAKTLNHWKEDTDLAGIRNAGALAKLPEAERKAWKALWADVASLQSRAATPTATEAKSSGTISVRQDGVH
jgi:tetratricopeptide (TPR) repeat protein